MMEHQINELMERSSDELYEMAGKELYGKSAFAFPTNPQKLIRMGKEYLGMQREKLKGAICSNKLITEYLKSPKVQNRVAVIAAIADILTAAAIEVSPVTASVLIFKEGLESLCTQTP